MKNLIFTLLALVGISQAQTMVSEAGRAPWGDSLRWGDSDDSTGTLRAFGNAIVRDSAGTAITITTDSCSKPLRTGFANLPNSKMELSYEVRTSSGNTDSSQVKIRFDTRYCRGIQDTTRCESWVPAGRFLPDTTTQIIDTLITVATTSGVTWKPTRQLFDVPGGNQIRACVDGYKAGGGAGDTTSFRRFVIRNSSVPAGGTPPSSSTLTGDITVSDVTVSSSALPTGAATSAKQPALGTAGVASTDVITVQGIASGVAQPVSGTVAATQSGTWTVQPGNTANTTAWKVDGSAVTQPVSGTVTANAGSGTMAVSLASVPSHAVTNAGTFVTQVDGAALTSLQLTDNLVLAEDAAHVSADPGLQALAVRRDANTTLATTDGDYGPLQLDAAGSLKVAITAGAGSGGTSIADDAAFTPASTSITPVGGTYISAKDAVNDGDAGAFAMTPYRAVHTYLVDANGDAVAVGGGTQYTEDAAETPAASLTMAGSVRRDTPASSAGTTGDNATLNTDANGRLWASATIDAALPAGTNAIGKLAANSGVDIGDVDITSIAAGNNNIGDVDIASSALPTGAATAAKQPALGTAGSASADVITIQGIASGTVVPVSDGSGSLTVDNGGTFAVQATLAAGAAAIAKAEDVAAADADVGVPAYAVRKATPANQSGTDGDYEPLQVSAGRLWASATIDAALPAGTNAIGKLAANSGVDIGDVDVTSISAGDNNIGNVDVVTLPNVTLAAGTNTNEVVGDAAHDAAVAGNPLLAGIEARTSNGTAVASGDVTRVQGTIEGKLVTKPHSVYGATWSYAGATGGITNTTAVTAKAAAGAGVRNCVTGIQVINQHATVSTETMLVDGAAGTVLHRGWAQAAGGGYAVNFDVPLCGTANTLIEVDNVTTGSAVLYNLQGYTTAE